MSISKRKVTRYAVRVIGKTDEEERPSALIKEVLKAVMRGPKEERRIDDTAHNRFHLLDAYNERSSNGVGYFKSAKYHHRPPLISRLTLDERDNPKELEEGEAEKTHFAIGYGNKEALLLLESKAGGVSIGTFIQYLNKHLSRLISDGDNFIVYDLYVTGKFLDKLKEMSRATLAEMYTTSEVISDTFKKVIPMTSQTKEEVVLTIKAKRGLSIKDVIKSTYRYFSSKDDQRITRIKVYGKSEDNDGILLDTNKLAESEYVEVDLDENGQVLTPSITDKLKAIIKSMS